jgi:Ca2+-binding EF-hand superfamily protein
MSSSEATLLKEVFSLADAKSSGSIPSSMLGDCLRAAGKRITQEGVDVLVAKAGTTVTFSQFQDLYQQAGSLEKTDADIKEAFSMLLKYSGGEGGDVGMAHLRQALTGLGDKLTPQEVSEFLRESGLTNKTALSHDEFVKAVEI